MSFSVIRFSVLYISFFSLEPIMKINFNCYHICNKRRFWPAVIVILVIMWALSTSFHQLLHCFIQKQLSFQSITSQTPVLKCSYARVCTTIEEPNNLFPSCPIDSSSWQFASFSVRSHITPEWYQLFRIVILSTTVPVVVLSNKLPCFCHFTHTLCIFTTVYW